MNGNRMALGGDALDDDDLDVVEVDEVDVYEVDDAAASSNRAG